MHQTTEYYIALQCAHKVVKQNSQIKKMICSEENMHITWQKNCNAFKKIFAVKYAHKLVNSSQIKMYSQEIMHNKLLKNLHIKNVFAVKCAQTGEKSQ